MPALNYRPLPAAAAGLGLPPSAGAGGAAPMTANPAQWAMLLPPPLQDAVESGQMSLGQAVSRFQNFVQQNPEAAAAMNPQVQAMMGMAPAGGMQEPAVSGGITDPAGPAGGGMMTRPMQGQLGADVAPTLAYRGGGGPAPPPSMGMIEPASAISSGRPMMPPNPPATEPMLAYRGGAMGARTPQLGGPMPTGPGGAHLGGVMPIAPASTGAQARPSWYEPIRPGAGRFGGRPMEKPGTARPATPRPQVNGGAMAERRRKLLA